ncbi:FtsW/RodA/SpoVE family cell cycle protein [Tessaracoccus sp. HDW20]|nr:FtsW/RodA/SpoVE family cell cycle protein [Tessaracoccus coleopterorum]
MAPYYFIASSVAVLVGLGTLMVLSASSAMAMHAGKDPYYYVIRQLVFLGLGLILGALFSRVRPETLRRLGWPGWALAVALLTLVLVPGLGVSGGGNLNWVSLGPIQFQPSEFAKLALIVWCGTVFHNKRGRLHEPMQLLVPLIPLGGIILVLILAGRDLGTGLIIGLIIVLIMWFIGTPCASSCRSAPLPPSSWRCWSTAPATGWTASRSSSTRRATPTSPRSRCRRCTRWRAAVGGVSGWGRAGRSTAASRTARTPTTSSP